jgi:hypothetical protein
MAENGSVRLRCPWCGRNHDVSITRLVRDERLQCEGCSTLIEVGPEKLASLIKNGSPEMKIAPMPWEH